MASLSMVTVESPSLAAYTLAARPAGPAPTTTRSTTWSTSMSSGRPYSVTARSRVDVGTKGTVELKVSTTGHAPTAPVWRVSTSRP